MSSPIFDVAEILGEDKAFMDVYGRIAKVEKVEYD